jgi:hypothetical protein
MGANFAQMLKITFESTRKAGDIFFGEEVKPDESRGHRSTCRTACC